jgi:hypothetical protein
MLQIAPQMRILVAIELVDLRKGIDGLAEFFMSLIHTCELNDVNAFDSLTESLRHPEELKQHPSEWMAWNYRDTRLAAAA